jgi:hypothetical protein
MLETCVGLDAIVSGFADVGYSPKV